MQLSLGVLRRYLFAEGATSTSGRLVDRRYCYETTLETRAAPAIWDGRAHQ